MMKKIGLYSHILHALSLTGLLTSGSLLVHATLSDPESSVIRRSVDALRSTDTSFALQDSVPSLETLAATIIGKTVEELRALYPGCRDTSYSGPVVEYVAVIVPIHGVQVEALPCAFYDVTDDGRLWFSGIPRGTIGSLETSDESVRTRAGLGPGSSLGEIRAVSTEVDIYVHETVGWWATMDGRQEMGFVLSGFDRAPLMGGHKYANERLLSPELMPDSALVRQVFIIDRSKCPESDRSGFL